MTDVEFVGVNHYTTRTPPKPFDYVKTYDSFEIELFVLNSNT